MFDQARQVNWIFSGLSDFSLTYCSGMPSEGLPACTESIVREEILGAPVMWIAQWQGHASARMGAARI